MRELRELVLPHLVEARERQILHLNASATAGATSPDRERCDSDLRARSRSWATARSHSSSIASISSEASTASIASSTATTTPTTPVFSPRAHTRFPSSAASSLASSPNLRESLDGFVSSMKRPLTEVREEPHDVAGGIDDVAPAATSAPATADADAGESSDAMEIISNASPITSSRASLSLSPSLSQRPRPRNSLSLSLSRHDSRKSPSREGSISASASARATAPAASSPNPTPAAVAEWCLDAAAAAAAAAATAQNHEADDILPAGYDWLEQLYDVDSFDVSVSKRRCSSTRTGGAGESGPLSAKLRTLSRRWRSRSTKESRSVSIFAGSGASGNIYGSAYGNGRTSADGNARSRANSMRTPSIADFRSDGSIARDANGIVSATQVKSQARPQPQSFSSMGLPTPNASFVVEQEETVERSGADETMKDCIARDSDADSLKTAAPDAADTDGAARTPLLPPLLIPAHADMHVQRMEGLVTSPCSPSALSPAQMSLGGPPVAATLSAIGLPSPPLSAKPSQTSIRQSFSQSQPQPHSRSLSLSQSQSQSRRQPLVSAPLTSTSTSDIPPLSLNSPSSPASFSSTSLTSPTWPTSATTLTSPSSSLTSILPHSSADEWSQKLSSSHANFTIYPEPYDLGPCPTHDSIKLLASDWALARRHFAQHLVSTGAHYGVDSRAYALTQGKWAAIENTWRSMYQAALRQAPPAPFDVHPALRAESRLGSGGARSTVASTASNGISLPSISLLSSPCPSLLTLAPNSTATVAPAAPSAAGTTAAPAAAATAVSTYDVKFPLVELADIVGPMKRAPSPARLHRAGSAAIGGAVTRAAVEQGQGHVEEHAHGHGHSHGGKMRHKRAFWRFLQGILSDSSVFGRGTATAAEA